MPPRRAVCASTSNLFDWEPPAVAEGFAAGEVRAATLNAKLARALRLVLTNRDREDVAAAMTDWLDERSLGEVGSAISKATLDAYTAEGKRTHVINAERLTALCAVLDDIRPLALLVEELGFAIVEQKYVHLVRATILEEKSRELANAAAMERRASR